MHMLAHLDSLQESVLAEIKSIIKRSVDDVIGSLPNPEDLTSLQQRGIIARYTAVLEGNFIYWMTAAYLAVKSEEARPIIIENLTEEVRDSHPVMLRKFAMAAHAYPTAADAIAVDDELNQVRLFLGRLCGVQTLAAMAFFEAFIQKFMAYLASLAVAQGSSELEYTDVHGICDIAHSEGLVLALASEMAINPLTPEANLLEGIDLVNALMKRVISYEINAEVA
jgi:hypothetical protein